MTAVLRRVATIRNPEGLHLRAAGQFVRLANRFRCQIRVSCDGQEADGRSILDLTILAAGCGKRLDLEASGPDADEAILALAILVEAGFYEVAQEES